MRLTAEESIQTGREARSRVSRGDLGLYEPAAQRRDPVEILVEQGAGR